jgi:hypothetical protein
MLFGAIIDIRSLRRAAYSLTVIIVLPRHGMALVYIAFRRV